MRCRSFRLLSVLALGAMLIASLPLGGCAGQTARNSVLGPAMATAWPGVKEDALLGIQARESVAASAALGVANISPGVGDQRRGRVTEFDTAVTTFNRAPSTPPTPSAAASPRPSGTGGH